MIGLLTWLIYSYPKVNLNELFVCGLISSIIDIDHFISAGSISLHAAINLSSRPFLHNSLTLLILNFVLFCYFLWFDVEKIKWSLIFFIAWFTHHVRDANRHGLWFGSLYTTRPIVKEWYWAIILMMPLLFKLLDNYSIINFIINQFYHRINDNSKNLTHVV